ncbi:MAG TPA: hypothetical protein VNQ77_08015 [Frankiaceae bacterium]|nr:hypothetical protein [Frankiaceae bacterium]
MNVRRTRGAVVVAVLSMLAVAGGASPAAAQAAEDTVAPVVTVESAPPAATRDDTATVTFSATDPERPDAVLTFRCLRHSPLLRSEGPCSSPWTAGSLVEGQHSLRIAATDEAGNESMAVWVHWHRDLTAPAVWWTHLERFTTAPGAEFRWGGQDVSGVGSYDVRYRVARYDGTFGAYRYRDSAQGTTATSFTIALRRGYTYCVSFRARDDLGNLGAWQSGQCTAAPLDDALLTPSAGWTRHTSANFYGGTYTFARTPGRTLTLRGIAGRGVGLVARTCPGCGKVRVLVNGEVGTEISTNAAKTTYRKMWGISWSYLRTDATITLVTMDSKPVYIDGLAVLRA